MRKQLKEFMEQAAPTAYQLFWATIYTVIGGAVTAGIVALLFYLRSQDAAWLYPYLYILAGFFAACFLILGLSKLLTVIKSRQLQQAKHAQFISTEKGYLDHAVDKEKAQNDFNSLLTEIGNEIADVGKTAAKGSERAVAATGNPVKAREVAEAIAKKLNKHAIRMERKLVKLEAITTLLVESGTEFIKWFPCETDDAKAQLDIARGVYARLIGDAHGALVSTEQYRDSLSSNKGITQQLNTAVNRLVQVTEGVIVVIRKAENHYTELTGIIDRKLGR